jgi:hypothetical protein
MVVGCFLLAAAGLKADGIAFDPLAEDSFFGSPALLVASLEVEVLIGFWLLTGWRITSAWASALALFSVLAAVSLYMAIVGQRSCGCFGRVSVNPWFTFVLDVAFLAALLVCRPRPMFPALLPSWPQFRNLKAWGAVAAVLVGGALVLRSSDHAAISLARLRGESITIGPAVSDVGEGSAGDVRTFDVELTNRTDRRIRIVGGTSTCSCTAVKDLPITVTPGETRPISVSVAFRGSTGRFGHRFLLYTDDEIQPVVVARFRGRVVARAQ